MALEPTPTSTTASTLVSVTTPSLSTILVSASSLNISQCVTLKLSSNNYLLWKTQFESFLSSQNLLGYVNGGTPRPPSTVTVRSGETTSEAPNPNFHTWMRNDQLVLAWLFGSLSEEALRNVYGLHTSHEVWKSLAKKFNHVSVSRKHDLQRRLNNVPKIGKTMAAYLDEIKAISDQLDSIGFPVSDQEKIYGALSGLGPEYQSIDTYVENSMDQFPGPTFEDVEFKLINFENKLLKYSETPAVSPHLAFHTGREYSNRGRGQNNGRNRGYRGRGYSTRGRGFHQQINTSNFGSSERPTCQICGKYGHSAVNCSKRFDHAYQSEELHNALAAMRITDQSGPPGHEWYRDSGVIAHITNNVEALQSAQPYTGDDRVMVGNGDFLPITHIGSVPLQGTFLPLKDVLVCPQMAKSLMSVSKLCDDYPCSVKFDSDGVLVKDKRTKLHLA
ncbi:PREDICTED: uncharacterized protein LOC104709311 [Camelina sativa]|uniref:Uncharacterized protein LOC104709311 n=1 Tax=Camelina sativa TaxID=90675 RepID=A0ABM0TCM5_CAMSA|nr:PREDICTED: uncharacterized protein LOC104709311 [Camelina sativa]